MISFIRGYYVIVVEGVGLEQFLNHLIRNGISVYNVTRIKNTKMEFHIDRQDIKEFKNVYRGSKFDIKVKQKTGVPFIIKRVYKHKGMWICALVSLFFIDVYIAVCDRCIYTISWRYKKEALRNELYKVGVRPGVYKKSIDRKEVRDHMMSKFNDVAYLSINVKGTNIFVTVTKRQNP